MPSFMEDIEEIADTRAVKSRYTDAVITIIHNAKKITWQPQEVKHLPAKYANWVVNKSTRKRTVANKPKLQILVIVDGGKDESPIQASMLAGPQQLVDKPWFDTDGTPLKEVYVEVNSVQGVEALASAVENREAIASETKTADMKEKVSEKVAERLVQPDAQEALNDLEQSE